MVETWVIEIGNTRLAVLGQYPGTAAWLHRQASRIRGLGDLDQLAATLGGSCHLALSVDGHIRMQGTVSGLRRIFHATVDGMSVAADRADLLASLIDTDLDERWLAASLLHPAMPHPLTERSPWRDVSAVPPDSALYVAPDGRGCLRRWWHPPEPTKSLADGAATLREELTTAVTDRVGPHEVVACDLSGGMDSTSLCFLARRGQTRLVTMTVLYQDPANDDGAWADVAATDLAPLTRLVLASDDVPAQFTAVDGVTRPTDAPSMLLRGRAVIRLCSRLLTEQAAGVHLVGHGGDETVSVPVGYLHDLIRRDPLTALGHLRGHRARRRWPMSTVLRGLTKHRSYAEWLAAEADQLAAAKSASSLLDWGQPLRLPPWATRHAAEVAGSLLREAAATAEPLAPTRGQHQALHRIRVAAHMYRLIAQEIDEPPMALPLLDDRVVQACLEVRLEERGTPWAYKPLLVEAMRGIVPEQILTRTTKATTDTDFYAGIHHNRGQLLDMVENSQLTRRGLIDPEPLRTEIHAPRARYGSGLEDTLVAEAWLRMTTTATVQGDPA